VAFKARYAEFFTEQRGHYDPMQKKYISRFIERDPVTGVEREVPYPKFKGYRHLDELNRKLRPFSFRKTRAEIFDWPEPVFQKRYFTMTAEQHKAYHDLRDRFITELRAGRVTARNVLTRYLRLQQVTSNYLPVAPPVDIDVCPACLGEGFTSTMEICETCEATGLNQAQLAARPRAKLEQIGPIDPRLDATLDEMSKCQVPTIIWSRFTEDVTKLMVATKSAGRTPARYDGQASDDEKAQAKADFNAGRADVIIGHPLSGGRGVVIRGQLMIFHSHYPGLLARLQAQDRAEIDGRTVGTQIVDIIGQDTVDEKIVTSHRERKKLADLITGDDPREWL
jgi:hypothetical protein